MVKNIFIIVLVGIILMGCTTTRTISSHNRKNLLHLSYGMSKEAVLRVMGTKTENVFRLTVTNPYRTEMYHATGDVLEILFYFTDEKEMDRAITDDELTPIVLKNGKLDGWGWSYWDNVVQKYEIKIQHEKTIEYKKNTE